MDFITLAVAIGLLAAVTIIPFIFHIVQCVQDDWASMLIIGLVFPPVGWVHGVGIMFGVWG
jgi:hypothetical protein